MLKLYEIKNRKYNVFNPQGRERELLIFDISPSSNSKLRYKVRHEVTDAAQSVFRTRVRGDNSWNKIKEAESGRHFF
ncbi:MAG: hypothetical protein ABUJ92_11835 [Desulfobacterales bacterium]